MPPSKGPRAAAFLLAIAAAGFAGPAGAADPADLDTVRHEAIDLARQVQQRERDLAALEHGIDLRRRDLEGRQRGLQETRTEQAQLLGAIERVARTPPERLAFLRGERPIDRLRSELLIGAAVPALRVEVQALTAEINRIAALRRDIAAKQDELTSAREALPRDRDQLTAVIARRFDLEREFLPDIPGAEPALLKLGKEAGDIGDLIKRVEAATERRDKDLLARWRPQKTKGATIDNTDPTRPHNLQSFDPPQTALMWPVSGRITRAFGAAGDGGNASQGLRLAAPLGADVVAPFDGRVVYAGPFRQFGAILIIRHGGGYHSALGGLGRVDVRPGEWVLAGEPVGVMPESADKSFGGALYLELRRDGRPVDPQPWLAPRDESREGEHGDQRVRE